MPKLGRGNQGNYYASRWQGLPPARAVLDVVDLLAILEAVESNQA